MMRKDKFSTPKVTPEPDFPPEKEAEEQLMLDLFGPTGAKPKLDVNDGTAVTLPPKAEPMSDSEYCRRKDDLVYNLHHFGWWNLTLEELEEVYNLARRLI